ncbi:BEN domain-containing protein 5 isoform X2 [Protopterus annectens]|uniref:BEN domain-containing protein 5 isoform X2 n=1 Tax=Protopterus annectens TaxID=7888 RepID=UPI001CFBDC00|nr:BEN domain-containing protein 5 isoform X2 [Protopterus annectens]
MYAFVRFLEDNLCYALHASCVKDFKPKSRFDFDNQKVYMVYQNLDSEGENCGNWGPLQKAQILALADNKADLENSVMQKKIKIPKLTLDGLSEHEFEELKDSEKISDELGHNKSIQKQDGRKNDGSYRSLEAVVARLEKKNGTNFICNTDDTLMETSECSPNDSHDVAVVPRIMYEELLRNYQQQQQDMRHLQQELERTRRQLVQQAKKLKEYGSLVSEVRELRDLNRRLQDMLLLRLGSDCTPAQFSSGTNGPSSSIKTDSSPLVEPLRVNCPDSVSEQEDVKQEPIESDFELQDSYGEEANTSSYHPLPVPVLDKYVLENGRTVQMLQTDEGQAQLQLHQAGRFNILAMFRDELSTSCTKKKGYVRGSMN